MATIDRTALLSLLERLDKALDKPTTLCIIGSCALMLMGNPTRSSHDVDIWLPASYFDAATLAKACQTAAIALNPIEDDAADGAPYLQLIHPGIVQLPPCRNNLWGRAGASQPAWQGAHLTIVLPPPAILIATKLARCEDRDLSDSLFLTERGSVSMTALNSAVQSLPHPARSVASENIVLLSLLIEQTSNHTAA